MTIRPSAGKNGGPKIQPMAIMGATDTESLEKAHDILERLGFGHYIGWQKRGVAKNGNLYRDAWTITMVGLKRSGKFFRFMTPYLATKKQRAEKVLEYIKARESHSDFRTPITEHEWELAREVKTLNRKTVFPAVKLNTERPGADSATLSKNGMKGAIARWGNRD